MRDYLEFDTVPVDEKCAQCGKPDYSTLAMREGEATIALIKREVGEPPRGASIKLASTYHSEGPRWEIRAYYDDLFPGTFEYVLKIESEFPRNWDEEARDYLTDKGYDFNHPSLG